MTTLLTEKHLSPPWGFWATIGFSFLVFFVMSAIQGMILFGYGAYKGISLDRASTDKEAIEDSIKSLALDGDVLGLAEIPSAFIGVILILVFASLRKPLAIKDYLGLYIPKFTTLLLWIGIMFLAMILMQILTVYLGIETPEFMHDVYGSTENKPLLWAAVIIAAPFFEEFLFRGFLLEGLHHSLAKISNDLTGTVIAVIATSAIWAVIHMQYGWYEIFNIFVIGVILAIARLKTGSLYIPIAMHMLMNLLASIAMEFAPELEAAQKAAALFNPIF